MLQNNFIVKVITTFLLMLGFNSAFAGGNFLDTIYKRCSEDSLDNEKARGRVEWGYKCGFLSYQYYKAATNHAYKPKVFYPMGMRFFEGNIEFKFDLPTEKSASCDALDVSSKWELAGKCLSSCYTPDQQLLFPEGEMTIYDAFTNRVQKIVTLTDDATFEHLTMTERSIDKWVVSIKDTEHDILVIKTADGQLKVTPNHPLVLSDGTMVTAGVIKVGQSLIRQDGSFSQIQAIDKTKFYGKVYNVEPDATNDDGQISMNGHIVIAQGFLSGSNFYQNADEARYLNQYLLRHQIPETLLN